MAHKYAEILRAIAENPEVKVEICIDGEWKQAEAPLISIQTDRTLRLKPDTIKIGPYDVPKPVTNPLHSQWRVAISIVATQDRMITGMEHSTQEAAWTHAKALASLTCL